MNPRFYQKIEIFEIQNFNKIPSFTIYFYFFSIFGIFFLFHLSKLVQKLWNFLWWFIGRVRDLTSVFWKILKVLLKKILICEIFFFSKFYGLLFAFYFFIIFDILFFNFVYLYLSKNSRNFYVFLFFGLEILLKIFGKSWNVFQKNIDIWNPKFFINSIVYYLFFFILLLFW